MAGFRVIKNIVEAELEKLPVSSQTLSPGDLIERTAGTTTWAACTSSTNHFTVKAIAMETVTSAATEVLAQRLSGLETVICEGNTTASTTYNGDRMALVDKNTVDNNDAADATGQAVAFVQEGIGPGSTDVVGRILVGNGVDPDAA